MKTLIKLAKQRATHPILNSIMIKGGVAYSTDLDMQITEPCDKPEGLYHSSGFAEGLDIPFDGSTDDFPSVSPFGTCYGTCEVSADEIAFLLPYMSTEETRYYPNGICFNGNDMVSTDNHRLGKVTLDTSFPQTPYSVIIPNTACRYVVWLAKEHKVKSVTVHFHEKRIVFKINNAELCTKLIDGTYPDYTRVIPAGAKHTTTFDPAEFEAKRKDIEALRNVAGLKKGFVKIRIGEKAETLFDKVQNLSFEVSCKLPEESIYNYDYLLSMQAGELGYNDPCSPVTITNGNRLCVLMPMRF